MHKVYIGLGANQGAPIAQLTGALQALARDTQISALRVSKLYASKPMGPQDQPDYVNAVAEFTTLLTPLALLDKLQALELQFGRVRKDERWGPRTLDLDILLFADAVINTPRLTVPHYGMTVREFVIYPLSDLAPSLCLANGQTVAELKQALPANGIYVMDDNWFPPLA
ncbi:2-amino-4-hydroxy-6-hydroxymethyldihydropteridine diphosphokinase [Pseudoalteromonas fenneropenaei]|uniref:2-amino-4-hydroxy-6-hydroxymethyldihydropteridine pyrophosphokinase n=1 Tax=Pseudoalteromonas fenneropenaei TaxID=1737459 RepID=A0ABV7CKM2_9GAMM